MGAQHRPLVRPLLSLLGAAAGVLVAVLVPDLANALAFGLLVLTGGRELGGARGRAARCPCRTGDPVRPGPDLRRPAGERPDPVAWWLPGS